MIAKTTRRTVKHHKMMIFS